MGTTSVPSSETRAAILVEEAESFHLAGKSAECRALLTRALQLDPEHARALALARELDGRAIDDVARRDPELAKALASVSGMIAAGQLPAAKASLEALQRDHAGDPAVAAARRRWDARNAKEAREKARRDQEQKDAAAARQKMEDDWAERVGAHLGEGRYSDAGRDLAQWLVQSPGSSAALGLRVRVESAEKGLRSFEEAFREKRYQDALAALQVVEQANPSDPGIAELRRKAESARAAARSLLTVHRLGPRGTLLLDGRPLGAADEIEGEIIPAGSHMLVVKGESIGSVSRALESLDGQRIVLVYDLRKQVLRPMEEADQSLLARRRASEEVHRFSVEHVHGVFRGTCKGDLLVALPDVEFKAAGGAHRFQHPFRQLNLKVDGKAVLLLDGRSGAEILAFRTGTPAQGAELRQVWDRFKDLSQ
jgi:tetratricopeptide (TPR) repeat protein